MAMTHTQKSSRVVHSSSANAQPIPTPPVMLFCAHPGVRLASRQNDKKKPVTPERAGFFVVQRRVNGVDQTPQGLKTPRRGSKIQFSRG